MKNKIKILSIILLGIIVLTGCTKKTSNNSKTTTVTSEGISVGGVLSIDKMFTTRDLEQTVDTSSATTYEVENNKDITISKEGIYVIRGTAENVTITVSANDSEKVQLVLKELSITNKDTPCIYVKTADKVFITTMNENSLTVTDNFKETSSPNLDAVIFSKSDIVLNGTGNLTIKSTDNGISSKDDLKITGGTITIDCKSDALEANDSVSINDGNITITSQKDGIHSEYDEDDSKGYVYIGGGNITITATDDAIHGTTIVQIEGGTLNLNSREGIEATYIQINGGDLTINSNDDGMNAGRKSNKYTPTIEINGGNITITMGAGDTDAVDSNGNLYINGGTINITAQSAFDYDGEGNYTGGTIIVNGEETNTLTNQMMGGGPNQGGQNQQRGNRQR